MDENSDRTDNNSSSDSYSVEEFDGDSPMEIDRADPYPIAETPIFIDSDDDETYMSLTGSSNEDSEIVEYRPVDDDVADVVEEDENFENNVNIDPSLPGTHSYLNKDMEQIVGRTIFDEYTVTDLNLFWHPNVILVPGQRLPIQLPLGRADIFLKARETHRIIGFIASPIDRANLVGCVGTTAELLSIRSEETGVTAMVVGRQRFKTISVTRKSDNNLFGSVLILCEFSEVHGSKHHPLSCSVPLSWRRYGPSSRKYLVDSGNCRHYESLPSNITPVDLSSSSSSSSPQNHNSSFLGRLFHRKKTEKLSPSTREEPNSSIQQIPLALMHGDSVALLNSYQSTWLTDEQLKNANQITTPAVDSQGRQFSFSRVSTCYREPRIASRRDVYAATAHSFGRFPSWVYELYDTERLIALVIKELKDWNKTWKLDHWTEEISVQFSYWLLQNLPVPDKYKIVILETDHVVARLQGCLELLRKCSNFLCISCQELITTKQKIVCLATEGSLQTFVNPHGTLHEMLTVSSVSNIHLHGRPTEEYSWFPGYAWTIMQCRTCLTHIGWKFTACKSGLKPTVFYGVCRSSVIPHFHEEGQTQF